MARPKGRDRTETIKERAIYVYLPSQELVNEWKDLAKKSRVSISKFVLERVENSLRQEEENSFIPRAELIKRMEELKEENSKLRDESKILRSAYERLDSELKHYRAKPFLEERFEGVRVYEKELISLLKERKQIDNYELLKILKIDPKESTLVKAVSMQLETLEGYGLVEQTMNGWRWIG